jgi:hypothetical protein
LIPVILTNTIQDRVLDRSLLDRCRAWQEQDRLAWTREKDMKERADLRGQLREENRKGKFRDREHVQWKRKHLMNWRAGGARLGLGVGIDDVKILYSQSYPKDKTRTLPCDTLKGKVAIGRARRLLYVVGKHLRVMSPLQLSIINFYLLKFSFSPSSSLFMLTILYVKIWPLSRRWSRIETDFLDSSVNRADIVLVMQSFHWRAKAPPDTSICSSPLGALRPNANASSRVQQLLVPKINMEAKMTL